MKQIDANLAEISVTYDQYGRLSTVRKPGDSASGTLPTLQFAYHIPDANSRFFWSEATQKLDESHTYSVRKFYNGIGELIQTQQVGVKVSDAACGAETCTTVSDQKTEYVNGVKTTTQAVAYAVATPAGYVTPTWANVTVTTYDAQDRPLVIKAPGQTDANKQSFSYDLDLSIPTQKRLKTTAIDAANHSTLSWKDSWNRTVKVQPATGPALKYEYDLADRLKVVKQVWPNGTVFATTTIEYDVAGRKLNMTDPDMGKWYYDYDAQGNLTRQTDAKGQRICLYYDVLNRLTGKRYRSDDDCAASTPALSVSYSYDANTWGIGRRTGMSDASGSTTWSYDARGRVMSETKTVKDGATVLGTYTTSWTYTSADRVATMTYPKGSSAVTTAEMVTYDYRPQGTLTKLTSSYNLTYLTSASVDAAGRPTLFELGNGTQTKHTYYAWDAANRPQSGRLQRLESGSPDSLTAGTPNLQSFEYIYDWAGNITNITQKVGDQNQESLSYTYDEINRLTSETSSANPSLVINSAYSTDTGNLVSKGNSALGYEAQAANCPPVLPGTPAKVHAATSRGSDAYCYDENGNMTRRTISTGTYTLGYDSENRLTQISGGGGPTYSYVYDGDGQRVLVKQSTGDKTIYIGGYFEVFIKAGYTPPAAPPARNCGTMRCIFVPLVTTLANPPATAGQVWKSYYSTGSGRVMRVQDNAGGGNSGIFWLYADHLGSTTLTARMDAIGGTLLSTLSYTAWGETRSATGTMPTSMHYTGQREAEAGLYFYQARWYDPALGRFAQADTIVPGQDAVAFDRYAYVNNNPLKYKDPSGHFGILPFIVAVAVTIVVAVVIADLIPRSNPPVNASSEFACNSSLPNCFGDVVQLKDFSKNDESNPVPIKEFEALADKVAKDLHTHDLGWPGIATGRGTYDTPFYNGGQSSYRAGGDPKAPQGAFPSNQKVCIETLRCSGRSEINYFAQGMWGAAVEEPEFASEGITRLWKFVEYSNLFKLKIETPSEDALFWLDYGRNYYKEWHKRQVK